MAVDRIGKSSPQSDIAIIGIACRIPGADHYGALWSNLAGGVFSVSELSPDRWDIGRFYSTDPNEPNKSVSKWCGQINGVKDFDNHFFNISPREARNMDPQQRLLLEEAWHCMEDSGVSLAELQARITSVYIGVMTGDYRQEALSEHTDVESYACLGNYEGMLANRISHVFQLRGTSSSLNAACASSLVAIHEAKRSLRSGECDYAIAGGVNLNLHPWKYIAFSKSRMLSPTGVCRTFDKDADGYVPGDGVGLVLMQRLEDAVRDGNHIYGVVKGSAVNHVGKSPTITAPSVESQRDLIVSAYEDAGRSPKSTTYVEAHGTGTSLGDPIEIEGLTQAFRVFTDRAQYCKIGSIKTNIGHLEAAAGVAGVIKVLMMMKHRQIPPSLHVRELNPMIDFKRSPFEVATGLSPWEPAGRNTPLLAGVSSLGFGGVNAHVLLEEAPKQLVRKGARRSSGAAEEPFVFALSAQTNEALERLTNEWERLLESDRLRDNDWRDISYTLLAGRTAMSRRIAACVKDAEELKQFLRTAQAAVVDRHKERISCLRVGDLQWTGYSFAGQLSRCSFSFRRELDAVAGIVKSRLGRGLLNGFRNEQWDEEKRPLFSFIVAHALVAAWRASGLTFDRITGERSGVWTALALSGMVAVEQAAAVLSGAMPQSEVRLSRPEAAFYDWTNDRVIESLLFHEPYLRLLAQGSGSDETFGSVLQEWMDKSRLLIDNQFTFRKFVGEWSEGYMAAFGHSLYDIVSGSVPWSAGDAAHRGRDRVLGLALLSSFRRLNRKWDLQIRSAGSEPLLEELADLVEDGVLTRDTAMQLLLEDEPNWSDIVSGMNAQVRLLSRRHAYTLLHRHNGTVAEVAVPTDWIDGLKRERSGESDDGMYAVVIGSCDAPAGGISYHPQAGRVAEQTRAFAVQLWLEGWELQWDRLLPFQGARKAPLPVYSFKRQSHWWDKAEKQTPEAGLETAEGDKPLDTLYHAMVWKPAVNVGHASFNNGADGIIVLDSTEQLANRLRDRLGSGSVVVWVKPGEHFRQTGEWRYDIDPADEQAFVALFGHLKSRGISCASIVHNGSHGLADMEERGLALNDESLRRGIYSLFAITKAFYAAKQAGPVRLLYLYAKEGRNWPLHAAVAGFCRTLRQENAQLRYTLLEHDSGAADRDKADMCLSAFASEHTASCELSYRGETWFERAAEEIGPSGSRRAIRFKDGGVYLITGGAGGLGLITAKRIASQARAKLVLAGRSAWKESLEDRMDELRRLGAEAVYVQADVSSLEDTRRLIGQAKDRFGSLDGIIHCAGQYGSGFAYRRTREQVAAVIAPKVKGAEHLDEAASGERLDFFLLFSSLSGVVGDLGLSDYAYANSFLDHFAELRESRRRAGMRSGVTVSIDWPLWRDGGIQIGEPEAQRYREATAQEVLPADIGIQAFDTVLSSVPGHQVLVSYGDADRIRSVISQRYEETGKPIATDAQRADAAATPALAPSAGNREERIGSAPTGHAEYSKRTTELLSGILASELGRPESDIDPKAPFEQYGIDSILIHHVNARLEQAIGNVSKTLLFECSNLAELSEYLVINHGPELSRLFGLHTAGQAEAAIAQESAVDEQPLPEQSLQEHETHRFVRTDDIANERKETGGRQDIAIIGVSGRYPGADNLTQFWDNLVKGKDCVTDVPEDRWDIAAYYDSDPARSAEGAMYCRSGGFIGDVDKFDPLFFKLSPKEAELMDPQERLFLETAWAAFEDAGYSAQGLAEATGGGKSANVGVFVGVTTNSYALFGPDLWRQGNGAIPLSMPWSIANRVSYVMNFDGPSMPVDTACASSLSAVAMACDSIRNGDCRMALAGGVNLYLHPAKFVWLSQTRMISPDGKCFTFSDQANGFGPGEGVGAVILKPLSDAIRDGDQIYAVVKAATVNHGGKTNGYTVPNPNAQANLVAKALRKANIHPRTVSYIEAHGTGTLLGDPIEITGLTRAFREGTDEKQFCAIGSVKTNIGHLESAAGIAGLTKLLLQMKHRTLVPSLHAERLNPNIDFEGSPFYVQRKTEEWKRPVIEERGARTEYPRRAGISSFGAGGANAHVVLEEYIPSSASAQAEGPQLVVLSAKSKTQLKQYARRLAARLAGGTTAKPDIRLQGDDPGKTGELQAAERGAEHSANRMARIIADAIGICPDRMDTSVPLADYGLDPHHLAALAERIGRECSYGAAASDMLAAPSIQALLDQQMAGGLSGSDMSSALMPKEEAAEPVSTPERSVSLADVAYTTQVGRTEMEERAAFVAADIHDLLHKLAAYGQGHSDKGVYEDGVRSGKDKIELLQGAAGAAFLEQVMAQGDLEAIARLWTAGLAIDWARLHRGAPRRRVSLPTYPFARERYWLPEVPTTASPAIAQTREPKREPKREAHLLRKEWRPAERQSDDAGPIPGLAVVVVNEESRALLPGIRFAEPPLVVLAEGDGAFRAADGLTGELAFNLASVEEGTAIAERIVQSHAVTGLLDLSDLYARRMGSDLGKSGKRALLQTLLLHRRHEPFTIVHMTSGLQAFETERPTMAGAAAAGFVKMLGAEYVKVRSATVDIDLDVRAEAGAALGRIVCQEWGSARSEGEIVYRGDKRYAPFLTAVTGPGLDASIVTASIQAEPLRPVMITGGMRGIGAKLAEHLAAAHKAKRLVLMGLQPMPPRSEWERLYADSASGNVRERIELVRRLEEAGAEVELYGGPLTDRTALTGFLDRIRRQWGRFGGVFHCAGSNRNDHPAFIYKQEDSVATVMEPKTEGLHVLSECLQDDRLSYFVLFSSISAVVPDLATGLSDYAAANSYMDYFAAYQHALGNTSFRAINWPSWKEVGMGEVTSGNYRKTGLLTHTTEEGMAMLHAVMSRQGSAAYIPCLSGEEPLRFDLWLAANKREAPALPGVSRPAARAVEAAASAAGELPGAASILGKLRQLFAEGLRLDPAKMDADTPFGDFGMESVLLNDMVYAIDRWAGTKLDPTVLLEHPTLDSLSRYLAERIGPVDTVPEQQQIQTREPARVSMPIREPVPMQAPALERLAPSAPERLGAVSPADSAIAHSQPASGTGTGRAARIAVIGMAAHLPGAKDVEAFWSNLASGACSITEVPASRWSADRLYSPAYERGKSISKWGGFIDGIEQFDPAYFGLNEQEAEQFDPLIRQFLEVSAQTIRHAGYEDKELSGRKVGVFVGSRAGAYAPRLGLPTKGTILGIGQNFIAAHLAHHYNLKGPNLVIDTACSSSLVSVHMACQSLIAGESEMAIAGGVDILLDEKPYLILSEAKALSPDGRCHTFDEKANGFVPGEGAGAVMLKLLDHAVRDGDRIYAVIDGSAVNNDGRTMGVTTPNPIAQQEVIAEAMAKSGIDPATIGYVETHGTGTMIGDPIELKALASAFRSASGETQYCAVGSVKTNVGHLLSAAGIASLIKVVLSLGNRQIPPTLHCDTPNPRFQFGASPFYPAVSLQEWQPRKGIRRAGISSFGFGGTNAHVIVSEYERVPGDAQEAARKPLPPVSFNRKRYWAEPEEAEYAHSDTRQKKRQSTIIPFLQMERIQ